MNDLITKIDARFVSGNDVPVTRTHLTREEWQELRGALLRLDYGWIEWHGGECPVDPDSTVEWRSREGAIGQRRAGDLFWLRYPEEYDEDLVAYRVVN